MQTVAVDLAFNPYSIYIGSGLLNNADLLESHIKSKQIVIISNQTVASFYLELIKHACSNKISKVILLPDGEKYKNWASLSQIFDILLENKYTRKTTLLALGGGVIGDMTGFAAACYMRGIAYIQLPTTLLAQVDASVGGKTGINHPLGKNMIGAFYQPKAVIIDINTLKTLPEREFKAGLAEVIKYGLIQDVGFFSWLEENIDKLLQKNEAALMRAITRCCEIKAQIVAVDEKEDGLRALLNFGHTFGHAIESVTAYATWLHGEAVSIGMVLAANLSAYKGYIAPTDAIRIRDLLEQVGLPVMLPAGLLLKDIVELMARDKKNIHGRLRLVLLNAIGDAKVTEDVSVAEILRAL
jgi:3-dehydroquinate synthase